MMAFHTATPGNAAVTAFMRWPALTTLMAASMTFAGYMPQDKDSLLLQACSKVVSSRACDRLLGEAKQAAAAQASGPVSPAR